MTVEDACGRTIDFFSEERLEEIRSKSLVNCHAIGMDSIVFDEGPGKSATVRMFICNKNHTLWTNRPPFHPEMSIAVHSHHCDVRLKRVYGVAYNIVADETIPFYRLQGWKYRSAILSQSGSFERTSDEIRANFNIAQIVDERLRSKDRHTVWVPQGQTAAWMVYEGAEDPSYDSTCFSVADLRKFDFSELYKPMPMEVLVGHLEWLAREPKREQLKHGCNAPAWGHFYRVAPMPD